MHIRQKFFALFVCSLMVCSVQPDQFVPPVNAAQMPPAMLGNGGLGPQAQFKPDDVAAQEEFNQILEELNQMPEEKLRELEVQLQAEVKRELEAMTPERRAEFDREMAEFWRSQGVDPNQLPSLDEMLGMQPTEQRAPDSAEQSAQELSIPQKKTALVPVDYSAEDAAKIVDKLIASLESLRRKMAAYPQMTRKLQAWKEAIDDLVYYLKVMDQPEHHERIVVKEFSTLLKNLKALQQELATSEPQLTSRTKTSAAHESPYDILRVSPTAPDEDIKYAYERYLKEHDPVALRKKLQDEDFEESEIEGRIKAAKLNIRTIKEAYEKVSNPKIRAQTDRALAAEYEQSHVGEEKSQGALNAILNALSQAIYQKNLLEDIQRFMKKYEPVKLEQRKKMEAAESKRRKEQVEAGKLKPTQTPVVSTEPYYLPASPSYQPSGAGYYPSYGSYGSPYGAPAERGYGQAIEPSKAPETGKTGGKSDGKAAEPGKDKGAEKTADKTTAGKSEKEKEKKQPAADWSNALQTLSKELDQLDSEITIRDSTAADKLRPKLDAMAKLSQEISIAQSDFAKATTDRAEPAQEADEKVPAVAAGPNPEQLKQLQDVSQDVITFLESSKRTESLQKAMSSFAKAEEKATEEKTKIPNKEKALAELMQKPAFGMVALVATTPQQLPVRKAGEQAAADLFGSAPKTKKLLEATNALLSTIIPAPEKKSEE